MLTLADFDYDLPLELIAHQPVSPRDSSRLLVVDRSNHSLSHHHFYDLPRLLTSQHVLVRNNTKVIPARIFGQKTTGGHVELLLIKRLATQVVGDHLGEVWECMTKPGLKPGQRVVFSDSTLEAECVAIAEYARHIVFNQTGHDLFNSLYEIGHTPLPPYINWAGHDEPQLRQLYQTMYAKYEGSAAAPTAGLHFTPELDQQLLAQGVVIEEVTLHVGMGTFLRVKVDDVTQHHMHSEWFELRPDVAQRLNAAKAAGKTIVAVGTTTTRVLETCATPHRQLEPQQGQTAIYIYPPYQFKFVDHLITNFHERKSTLLMLVSALATQPNTPQPFTTFRDTLIGHAYQTAVAEKYRFHSFGDAMLIR